MYLAKSMKSEITIPTRLQYVASTTNSINPLPTPQNHPLHDEQVKNNAGGYVFQVDDMVFFQRFLFLGTEKGTYYVSQAEHTHLNIECIDRLLKANRGEEMLNLLIQINDDNRAAKTGPINFSLAYLAKVGDISLRKKVYKNLNKFLRIPTHLFEFLEYSKTISKAKNDSIGWGRLQRQFVQQWYGGKDVDHLAYQVTKYQQRNGWSHKDVFRLAHVRPDQDISETERTRLEERRLLYTWIVKKEISQDDATNVNRFLNAFTRIQKMGMDDVPQIVSMIEEHRLVREHLPTTVLNSRPIWEALLRDMPLGALIRNLNKLTKLGILDGYDNEHLKRAIDKLTDEVALSKARIHPLKLMVAMLVYSKGHGNKGDMEWSPNQQIVDALNDAYYKSFKFVAPTRKRFLIAVDISGSMGYSQCVGSPLNAREGAACLALTLMKMEEKCVIKGFSHNLVDLKISPGRRLDDNIREMSKMPFGATDLALPIEYAMKNHLPVDCFVVLSDNETWYGSKHPSEVLRAYRRRMNMDSRYVNIQMSATRFSVADPQDVHSLEIAGFDSGMMETISEFLNWELV